MSRVAKAVEQPKTPIVSFSEIIANGNKYTIGVNRVSTIKFIVDGEERTKVRVDFAPIDDPNIGVIQSLSFYPKTWLGKLSNADATFSIISNFYKSKTDNDNAMTNFVIACLNSIELNIRVARIAAGTLVSIDGYSEPLEYTNDANAIEIISFTCTALTHRYIEKAIDVALGF